MPKISVIIPAYNAERYIAETIESVLAQTFTDYELIVVDDGSIDNTGFVAKQYPKVRYLYKQNEGVSKARNMGLKEAHGEWVLFLDADDVAMPDKLTLQMTLAHPHIDIIHSGWWTTDTNGQRIAEAQPWMSAPKLDLETWLFWKPLMPSAMLFRRSSVLAVGGFNPHFTHSEDVDLVWRMALNGSKACWLQQPTVHYRQHSTSASSRLNKVVEGIERVLDEFFSTPHLPKRIQRIEADVRYHSLLWYVFQLYQAGQTDEATQLLRRALSHAHWHPAYLLFLLQRQWRLWADKTELPDFFNMVLPPITLNSGRILSANEALHWHTITPLSIEDRAMFLSQIARLQDTPPHYLDIAEKGVLYAALIFSNGIRLRPHKVKHWLIEWWHVGFTLKTIPLGFRTLKALVTSWI